MVDSQNIPYIVAGIVQVFAALAFFGWGAIRRKDNMLLSRGQWQWLLISVLNLVEAFVFGLLANGIGNKTRSDGDYVEFGVYGLLAGTAFFWGLFFFIAVFRHFWQYMFLAFLVFATQGCLLVGALSPYFGNWYLFICACISLILLFVLDLLAAWNDTAFYQYDKLSKDQRENQPQRAPLTWGYRGWFVWFVRIWIVIIVAIFVLFAALDTPLGGAWTETTNNWLVVGWNILAKVVFAALVFGLLVPDTNSEFDAGAAGVPHTPGATDVEVGAAVFVATQTSPAEAEAELAGEEMPPAEQAAAATPGAPEAPREAVESKMGAPAPARPAPSAAGQAKTVPAASAAVPAPAAPKKTFLDGFKPF